MRFETTEVAPENLLQPLNQFAEALRSMNHRSDAIQVLRRYTELPSLLATLRHRELTLLNPQSWDDRTDRAFMLKFAETKGFKVTLGLCFTQAVETFHHWKVFAPGPSGVCIEFEKDSLLAAIPPGRFTHGRVTYKRPTELPANFNTSSRLAFTKGWVFRDEREYRIIYASSVQAVAARSFPISLSFIRSITLSPWLAPALFEAVRETILQTPGCRRVSVLQSRVVENENWLRFASDASCETNLMPGR